MTEEEIADKFENWFKITNLRLNTIIEKLTVLADSAQADFPAGEKSALNRKRENLIKVYAEYLIKKENLSKEDAQIRAAFDIYNFLDEDKIIKEIDGIYPGSWGSISEDKSKIATKRFYKSGILERDIKSRAKDLWPVYLMAPIYDVVVKQDYQKGDKIKLSLPADNEDDYYKFVENRAIIYKLEKFGVLKKINNEGWDGEPEYILTHTDIPTLKNIIYEGKSSHEDDYFEEQYNEGKLTSLLCTTSF